MNPKMTPEIRAALTQHPIGPVQLDDDASDEPVFVVRLGDLTHLRDVVDERVRSALNEADEDIAAGRVHDFDADDIKRRGRQRLNAQKEAE